MLKINPFNFFLPVLLVILMGWGGCREKLSYSTGNLKVDSLDIKIQQIRSVSADVAMDLAQQGLESSIDKKLPHYEIEFRGLIGSLFSNEGRHAEGIENFDKGIELAINQKDTLSQANLLSKRGYAYMQIMEQDDAMEDITSAILLLNRVKNANPEKKDFLLFNSNLDLVSFYAGRQEYDKAFSYAEDVKKLLDQNPDPVNQARYFYELAWLQLSFGSEESDISYLQQSIQNYRKGAAQFRQIGNVYMANSNNLFIADAFELWIDILKAQNKNRENSQIRSLQDSSDLYFEKQLSYLRETNSLQSLASTLQTLAQKSIDQKKYYQAIGYNRESLEVAGQLESRQDSALGYWLMAEIYEGLGKLDSSIWYLQEYDVINYNQRRLESEKALKFAEAGFQTEKKELENQKIKIQARQRLQGTISIATVIGLILISFAFYYYISNINKKKLMAQQQKINQQLVIDLMKEQTIESLNSRLQGQEKERKRIAKELHDTLGGTLAALKLSMEGLKRNLDDGTKEKFKHPQELLKMAYQETRQLSHEMMALPLKHLGLEPSIKSLCQTINRSGKIEVEYQTELTVPLSLNNEAGTHVYRILQELLQNVIKHARANKVWVNLLNDQKGFTMTVKDNGRGFPKQVNNSSKGMGLSNIEDRVTGLRGVLHIQSEPGQGSEVSIFLPKEPMIESFQDQGLV